MMEINSALLRVTEKRLDKAVIAGKVMEKYLSVFQAKRTIAECGRITQRRIWQSSVTWF